MVQVRESSSHLVRRLHYVSLDTGNVVKMFFVWGYRWSAASNNVRWNSIDQTMELRLQLLLWFSASKKIIQLFWGDDDLSKPAHRIPVITPETTLSGLVLLYRWISRFDGEWSTNAVCRKAPPATCIWGWVLDWVHSPIKGLYRADTHLLLIADGTCMCLLWIATLKNTFQK